MKPNGTPSFRKIGLVALMLVSYTDTCVLAAPQGGHVVSGSASFQQQGNLTTITAGNRSIINYTGFNIAPGETVRFVQPNASSTVLNRVLSPNPTSIFGQLQSNGIVYIVNPYGVYFQNGAVLNVGGLYAAAGSIANQDFTAGRVHFTDLAGDVRNDGVLAADNPIALLGAHVVNNGTVSSAHGSAALISAGDVYVGTRNGNIFVQANGGAKTPSAPGGSITNRGTLAAPSVMLGAGDLYSTAIVNTGLLQGRQIAVNAGQKGSATVSGRLNASSAKGKGGSIQVTGGKVALQGAKLDASGRTGGGSVRVGGDFHGGGTLLQATTTTVDAGSTINASSSGAHGGGGSVVLWSSSATTDLGTISARGGSASGNGGAVEVSSHNDLGFYGLVDTRAPGGRIGSLLLDPSNIEVTAGGAVGALPPPQNDPTTVPPTLTVSQASLEASSATFTLAASNDIRIDPMMGGKLTLQADATFTAGVPTSASQPSTGSVVMANLADMIIDPGHNVTILANGVSVGAAPPAGTVGTGINGASPYAIEVGGINTSSTTGNGGTVILNNTGVAGVAVPVHVAGSIITSSPNNAAGAINISGTALTVDGALTATGATGGGSVNLTSAGSIGVAGNIDASSATTGAGGTVSILTQPSNAASTDTLAGINTSSGTGTAGRILLGTDGTTISAPGSLTLNGPLVATGGTGGAIFVEAVGAITGATAATFNASGTNGAGGNITLANLTGAGVTLGGGLTSTGTTAGGGVSLQSNGAISLPTVDTSATAGTGGTIAITGAGLMSGALNSSGLSGGAVTLSSGDALTVTGTINSSATGGTGGTVQLLTYATAPASLTPINIAAINSSSSAGNGGTIIAGPASGALPPTSLTINGALTASGSAAGGNVSLSSGGAIQVSGDISAASTTAGNGGGVIILTSPTGAAGGDSLAGIDTSAVSGNGGNIFIGTDGTSLFAPASLSLSGAINAHGSGNGGSVRINSRGALTAMPAATINTSGTTGTGSAIIIVNPGTGLTLGGALTSTGATHGGDVSLQSNGALSVPSADSSSSAGPGGAITMTGAGLTSGGLTSSGLGGGAVMLTSSGALTVTGTIDSSSATASNGGAIQLLTSATAAAVLTPVTAAALNSSSSGGAGGAITVGPATGALAPKSLMINSTVNTSGTSAGGNVAFTIGGMIGVTGAITAQSTTAGNGGSVTILTSPGGAAGGDTFASISTTAVSGNGGSITIGNATSEPAKLTLNGALTTTGSGNGGAVNITSDGLVTTVAATTIDTAGTNGTGGAISILDAGTGLTLKGALISTGATGGGNVTLSSNGALSLVSVDSSSTGGGGGSIQITGLGLTSGLLTSSGVGGGVVTLTSGGALKVTGAINASSTGTGNGGAVQLLTSASATGTLTPVTATSINTTAASGNGGLIDIGPVTGKLAPTSIALSGALTSSGTGAGGNVDLTASGAINIMGNIVATSTTSGNGGDVTILTIPGGSSGGDSFAMIDTAATSGSGGHVFIGTNGTTAFAPASLTLNGAINTTGSANGGAVAVTSGGMISTVAATTIDTSGTNGAGGAITVSNPGTGLTLDGALTTTGTTGGGSINLQSNGPISLASANSSATAGPGGMITTTSAGLTSGALTSTGIGGGAVTLTSSGALKVTGTIDSSSTGAGNGGAVELLASATSGATQTPVTVAAINATAASGSGGLIEIGPSAGALAPTSILLNGSFQTTSPAAGATVDDISVVTSGTIAFNSGVNPFLLNGNTLLQGQNLAANPAAALHFDLGGHNLTLNLAGNVTIDGVVGGTTGTFNNVRDFVTSGPVTLDGAFTTSGTQTYDNAVTLAGVNTDTRSIDATGAILFNNATATINGAPTLAIGAAGTTTQVVFDGVVGQFTAPNALSSRTTAGTTFAMTVPAANTAGVRLNQTLTVVGPTIFNVGGSSLSLANQRYSVLTGGAQTYGPGAVTLAADTYLRSVGAGITFDSAIAGPRGLLLALPGVATFDGTVGSGTALASLATTGGGTTVIDGGVIATSGLQSYGGPVSLGQAGANPATTLSAGAGGITFTGILVSAAGTNPQALTINSPGLTTFDAQVGGAPGAAGSAVTTVPALASLTTLGRGEVDIHSGVTAVTTAGGIQSYSGLVKLTGNATLKGHALSLSGAGLSGQSGAFSLTLDFSAPVLVSGLYAGLNNFASVGPGGTQIGGTFTTNGFQNYANAVTLTADATLASGHNGTILFNSTVAGPFRLTLNPSGTGRVIFNGNVGGTTAAQHLAALAINGATTILGGGTVATSGAQDYTGTLTLAVPTTLTSSASAVQVFPGWLAVNGGGNALTVAAASSDFGTITNAGNLTFTVANSGQARFTGAVTGTSLTVHGLADLGGSVTTHSPTLGQNYDALVLNASVTLRDTANGPLLFGGTVNADGGRESLTTTTGGLTTFDGAVGSGNALGSLTVSGAGSTVFAVPGGGVTVTTVSDGGAATGSQTYNEPVRLALAITLSSLATGAATNGGAILFANTVSSATATPENLTVLAGAGMTVFAPGATVNARALNIGGARVTFDRPVGVPNALGVLTIGRSGNFTGASSSIDLNSGTFTSTLGQTYNDAVVLSANTTLADTNSHDIVFNGSINGAFSLKLSTGGNADFNGLIGNSAALTALTVTATKTSFEMSLAGQASGVAGASVGTGGVTINGPTVFDVTGSGVLDLTHPTVTTTGAQTYNGAVTLAQDTSLLGTTGKITFASTVAGGFDLAADTGGAVTFDGLVGNSAPLAGLTTDTLIGNGGPTQFNLAVGAAAAGVQVNGALAVNGAVVFDITGSSLTQPGVLTLGSGAQTYGGAVSLAASTVLVSAATGTPFTGGGAIQFTSSAGVASTGGSDLLVRAGAGNSSFAAPVKVGSADLGGALVNFNGPVTLPGVLSVEPNPGGPSVSDVVDFNGGQLTTSGAQTFNAGVVLGADSTFTSTTAAGGEILFHAGLDGAHTLLLATRGLVAFDGLIGSTAPLTGLTVHTATTPGATQFNMDLAAVTGVRLAGALVDNGPTLFNAAGTTFQVGSQTVSTTGAQTYNGPVTLAQDTSLLGTNGPITFQNTAAGTRELAVNTGGQVDFAGLIGNGGPLAGLTINTLSGHGGPVLFNFNVGAAIAGVQVDGDVVVGGPVTFQLGGSSLNQPSVLTQLGGKQTYNGAVSLAANTVLTSAESDPPYMGGGAISFTSVAGIKSTGGSDLFVRTGAGASTFAAAVNAGSVDFGGGLVSFSGPVMLPGVFSVEPNAGGTGPNVIAFSGGTLTSVGTQTFNAAVLLGGDATFTSTSASAAGGRILFNSSIDGARTLTLNTLGSVVFDGLIGSAIPLTGLTAHDAAAPGATQFNMAVGTAPAGVDLDGALAVNGPVAFDITGSSANQPAILTLGNGTQTYHGAATFDTDTVLVGVTAQPGLVGGLAGGGAILFTSSVTGAGATAPNLTLLTGPGTATFGNTVNVRSLDAAGVQATFDGPVSGLGTLLVSSNGGTTGLIALNGGTVTTSAGQTYRSAVTLGANTKLISTGTTGVGDILFASTLDGAHALTLSTGGRTTFDGAVGNGTALSSLLVGNGSGAATINGPGVRTTGFQTYEGGVTVTASKVSFTSQSGILTFDKPLGTSQYGFTAVTLDAPAGSVLEGDVGDSSVLASLTVTGPLAFLGDRISTTGDQTYLGAVNFGPSSTGASSLTAGGNVRFYQNVNAGGSLAVVANRIGAQGNIITAGDLNLDSTAALPLLVLAGNQYVSTGGSVNFNTTPTYNPQGNASDAATIVLTNPGNTVLQGANFTVGFNQKIFSTGSLDINVGNGTATVGDLAARNDIIVNAGQIALLDHGATYSPYLGTTNTGLNIVAGNSINFGGAQIVFTGTGNRTASFVTTTGDTTIQQAQGISLFKDAGLASEFDVALPTVASLDSLTPVVFEPGRGGLESLDVAAALAGALPDQRAFDVQTDVTLTASQIEELKKLGIHPRLAQRGERTSIASKRALFAQLVDGEDPENYGRLQPIKGGVSRLEPSDYVVVVDRMGEHEVQTILKGFEELYGKNKEKAPEIGGAYQNAFNDYTVAKQTADPAGFAPYLQSESGKYPAVDTSVRNFDKLFGQLENLGLTDKEVAKSEEHIASDLGVSGLSPAEMVKTINALRQKLTPAQKAASTKAPPSAPVTNPAPGATAPAPAPAPGAPPPTAPAATPAPEMIPEIPAMPDTPTAQPTPPPATPANDVKPPDTARRRGIDRSRKVATRTNARTAVAVKVAAR